MSDDGQVVLCTPTAWPKMSHVPGTVRDTASCGHEVWVAPSTYAMLQEPDTSMECIPCALEKPEVQELLKNGGIELHRAQRVELNESIGVAATDQIVTAIENGKSP